jgi:steroid delta-isomerase-like uncharacterized protein
MSQTPSDVMRAWFRDVWNERQVDAIDRLYDRNGIAHGLGEPRHGVAAFRPVFAQFTGAFPDIRIEVERTIEQGEWVMAHCRVTGTHTGDALGVPPTRRRVEFSGVTFARISDGRIQEGWNYYDFASMYRQLGVPAPPPA